MYFPMTSTLVGNVGQDAELRTVNTAKGEVSVANFSIAINNGSGDDRQTQWVRVEVWRKYAEALSPYIKKGMKITVEVKQVKLEAYTDKEGEAQAVLVVVADKLHLPNRTRDDVVADAPKEIPF